jgi:hypothetical protein
MIDSYLLEKLRDRYSHVHLLLFSRSVERAKSNGELFDILETIPEKYPICWCEENRIWVSQEDLYFSDDFKETE